ncbi:MAG: FxsA family protein [Nitrospinae bacterium]|nr:FxsA family protein [Nitrospinota bacterium]
MFLKLFLLFTIVPTIEIWLIIKIGRLIGPFPTVAMLLISGAVGAYYARRQGLYVINQFTATLNRGEFPADALLDGLLVVVGGALMVAPGFITDIVGIILVTPLSRRSVKPFVVRWAQRNMKARVVYSSGFGGNHRTDFNGGQAGRPDDDVIDV